MNGTIYPTMYFIEKLLDRYFSVAKELAQMKRESGQVETTASSTSSPDEIDLSNTDHLASDQQHTPVRDWFQKKHIKVDVNLRSVDTSGFFDEVAEIIGANLPVLQEVLDRIRWSQQKEYASANISLEKKTPEEAMIISMFCQQLYDFSFVAKCFHNKTDNNVRLILQTAPGIRHFFNGEWLEWHALMTAMRYAKERKQRFSCARGIKLTFASGDQHELDVFMLINGTTPVCIECKSGEFRQDIDQYIALKKRLGLSRKQFIMCISGLEDEKATAFSSMYDLSFTNERKLADQLAVLF
ncbi:MAG: hypothetical protein KBD60_06070 [Sterolibacterium sp.]|nr:hypothetical protein [Sterolibacterium sp.]